MARSPRYAALQSLLIAHRKAKGITQEQLAAALRRPQSFVAKYEGGERRLDLIEFIEIAQAIGVDPGQILKELMERS